MRKLFPHQIPLSLSLISCLFSGYKNIVIFATFCNQKMIRELFQELFIGPNIADQNGLFWRFRFDRLVSTICIGYAWGYYISVCRKPPQYLEDKVGNFLRNRDIALTDPISAILSEPDMDINCISREPFRYTHLPYQYIDRDAFRLGDVEWSYKEVESTSHITYGGHFKDLMDTIFDESPVEYVYFKYTMRLLCGRFPESHLREMYGKCEAFNLEKDQVLMEIGDPDENMFVVLQGTIKIVVLDQDKKMHIIRTTNKGDRIYSLFSFIDVLTGHSQPIKTIEAYAFSKCRVLRFPLSLMKEYLTLHPDRLKDVVYRIVRKIYDVNFLMLHSILGLTLDLVDKPKLIFRKLNNRVENDPSIIYDPSVGISDQLRNDAIKDFLKFLEIPLEYSNIFEICQVLVLDSPENPSDQYFPTGHPVLDQNQIKFKYLYKGEIELYEVHSYTKEESQEEEMPLPELNYDSVYLVQPGEGVGGLATFAVVENFLFMRVMSRSVIVTINQEGLTRLFSDYPRSILPMARQIIVRLSPIVRQMDFGLEWTKAIGGKALFVSGGEVTDSFVVLSGRLRSYLVDPKGKYTLYAEYERLDWIGLIEATVTFPVRSKTVIAVRDTEICKVPMDFVNYLKTKFPSTAFKLLIYLTNRTKNQRFHERSQKLSPEKRLITGTSRRCASLALLPASEDVPYIAFAREIKFHHDEYGLTAIVSWDSFRKEFGMNTLTHKDRYMVQIWILSILERHDLVVFICYEHSDLWTELCFRHAELVITVGVQEERPVKPVHMERLMFSKEISINKRKELVILHKKEVNKRRRGYRLPTDTIAWLEDRPWLSVHHHLRIPAEGFNYKGLVPVSELDLNYTALNREIEKHSDMSRFCRWVMGKSVGIVFTGGGSRMAVQAGPNFTKFWVLKAMVDQDIPLDMVGGVGTGFVLAAFYSIYEDVNKVLEYSEKIFSGIGYATRNAFDITIPYLSPIQGRALLQLVVRYFARTRMEDTWIPVFCVTCDISKQDARTHRDGPLWTYVRASLGNFLGGPPICDPKDGGYIVDGSYANPIPEDVMRDYGAEYVLVINTSDGRTYDNKVFDANKDIWTNIWRLFLLLGSRLNFVTPDFVRINDMIGRTQKVMYAEAVEHNTNGLFVSFIKPNVSRYPSETYNNYNRMMYLGFLYTKEILESCPLVGVPFHIFWSNLRKFSRKLEVKQGRGMRHFENEELWDRIEGRIFERGDKMLRMQKAELKHYFGQDFRGQNWDDETIANAMQDKLVGEEVTTMLNKNMRHQEFLIDKMDKEWKSEELESEEMESEELKSEEFSPVVRELMIEVDKQYKMTH